MGYDIVLHKLGKPNYTIPKAYHPIALLNTTGKLLTAVVADQLTYVLEHHWLLLNMHFGGASRQINYRFTPSPGRHSQKCLEISQGSFSIVP
jgi:hypothetical protein